MSPLTVDKQVLLSGFLGQLPEHVAARLARAIEVDRLIGGTKLPHEEILRALRPRLRQHGAADRLPTPLRLFCRPFEDILVESDRTAKQKGRIARSSIEPVWNWLASELIPSRHRRLVEAIVEAIVHERPNDVESRAAELWHEAASALNGALAGDQVAVAARLGGIPAKEDAAEIALLIRYADDVTRLQQRLPKPIAHLNDGDIAFLCDTFDRLSVTNPDLAPYVGLIIMGRLERRWEVLRLAAMVSRKTNDTIISNTDVGIVGELLLADLEAYARTIRSVRPNEFRLEILLPALASFAELSCGMVRELAIRREGKWGQQLARDRAGVARTMEALLERVPKEILSGLPAPKAGVFNKGPRSLDVTRQPDPERVARSKKYAELMVKSKPFAVAAAFNARLNEVMEQSILALRSYGEEILRELRAAEPETRVIVERHFELALELCQLVLGEEEADFLRRRARVGLSA